MHYAIVVSATLATLAQAVPQAIKIAKDGPVFPADLAAEASSVLATMAAQSPAATGADEVTVTAKPLTVKTSIVPTAKPKATHKKTTKKTTKKATTKKRKTAKVVKKPVKVVPQRGRVVKAVPQRGRFVKAVPQRGRKRDSIFKRSGGDNGSSSSSSTSKSSTSQKSSSSQTTATSAAGLPPAASLTTTPAATSAATTTAAPVTDIGSACAVQPTAQPYYPAAKDDKSFLLDNKINADSSDSVAAAAPSGYRWVWRNMMKTPQADAFLGGYSLPSYNVSQCGSLCDGTAGCKSFNVYYERNPTLNPADACPDPAPLANIVCTIWGASVNETQLTNVGQWRSSFAVVIAGSNGYTKVAA